MESTGSRKNSRWKEACPGSLGGKRQVPREAEGMANRPLRRYSPSPAAEKGPGIHKGGTAIGPRLVLLKGSRGQGRLPAEGSSRPPGAGEGRDGGVAARSDEGLSRDRPTLSLARLAPASDPAIARSLLASAPGGPEGVLAGGGPESRRRRRRGTR